MGGSQQPGLVNIVMYPGLMLQKLTTKEPDDEQLEVAICLFLAAIGTSKGQEEGVGFECNQGYEGSSGAAEEGRYSISQLEAGMLMGHLLNCPRERLYMDRTGS